MSDAQKRPARISPSFVEREIRKLKDEGKLDNLPGAGKPIPGLDEPYDPDWWIKSLLKRENLNLLPETLQLRVDIERDIEKMWTLSSEESVRAAAAAINAKICRMNSTAHAGPLTTMSEMDVDKVLERWRGHS